MVSWCRRGTPDALAERVLQLLEDDGLRTQMAERAHIKAVRNFTIKRMVQRTEEVYVEQLGRQPAARLSEALASTKGEGAPERGSFR